MEKNDDPYRVIASITPDAIIVFGFADTGIEDANDAALALYGYAREEMIGLPVSALSAEPEASAAYFRRLALGETVHVHNRLHKRKDGSTFSVEAHATLLSVGGRTIGVSVIRDISEALRVQQDLTDSELRFRQIAENLDEVIWMTDEPKTRMEYISPAYERIWGRSCESLYAEPESWLDPILPEDRERVQAALAEQEKGAYDVVYRIHRPDGAVRWILDRGFPVRNAEGRIVRMAGMAQDVTEQRKTEERLRENKIFLEKAQEVASIGSWDYDIGNDRVHWSKECCRILGTREVEGRSRSEFLKILHPDDRASADKVAADAVASGSSYTTEYRVIHDGSVRWVAERADVVRDEKGRGVKLVGVVKDVTDEKINTEKLQSAEQQLRETATFLEKAQEVANIGSWIYDVGDDRVHWSKESCRIYGVKESGWHSKAEFYELLHPDDRLAIRKGVTDALASGPNYVSEFRVVRSDGTVRWISARADIVRDENGRAVKMLGINKDVTDTKFAAEQLLSAEQQLFVSQKLEAIGRLAGGVAHDFNNILTAILGLTEMSIKALPEAHPVRKDLEEVRLSSLRAAKLTHQLLAFSRRQVVVPKVLRFDDAILGVSKMVHSIIGEDIEIDMRLGAAGVHVCADLGHLEQLIVNLAVNARDAMPEGGTLTIETSAALRDTETAFRPDVMKPGNYAVLRVSDTGKGMDENVRIRIYEPFFTTKEQGKGTGLGLSTCYGIVKQHGGEILCDSRPGHGTSFRILLPRCEPETAVREVAARPNEIKGTERVLVVEDEEPVRRLVVRMLRECGYETAEARDGQEGLEVLARDAERRIRLVLTDMVMPRLGGRKMAAAMAASRPDVRILFTSGYTDDSSGEEPMVPAVEFLAKPFSAQELAEGVRRALDAG